MRFVKMSGNITFAFCVVCVAVTSPSLGADNPFDGSYSGTRTLTKDSDAFCPKIEEMLVTIQDGKFAFTNGDSRAVIAIVPIASDGSFSDIHNGINCWYIKGKITAAFFRQKPNSSACLHHWSLNKK
jgi:hypothetical protein